MPVTHNACFEVALFLFKYSIGEYSTMEQLSAVFAELQTKVDRDLTFDRAKREAVDLSSKNAVS